MKDEHRIIQQVYAAKKDMREADELIRTYMPFIRTETAKWLKRPPQEGRDDELSIAMIAFHEAVQGYSRVRGSFLKYAALTIKSRLIDYHRREQRHRNAVSLDTPADEDESPLSQTIQDGRNHEEELAVREATRGEIEELSRQMEAFGLCLEDVAENCPKQQRTLEACRNVLRYARETEGILEEFLRTKRLPITQLSAGSGVEKKTLERHRKYLAALLLIYSNGYEIIRGHLKQVMKGVAGK